jgi:putative ABC transport system ATP-binding protein
LDIPTEGSLTVLGQDLAKLTREQRAELRLRSLGFVFQAYNLVPVLTVRENVEFILELQGAGRERFEQAGQVLESLGLAELGKRFPKEISGGQQQRVAVARAIASKPKLVLADEPTANLDHANAETLMVLMRRLHDENGMTFLFSTHDPRVMKHATRVITLSDGRIEKESTQAS